MARLYADENFPRPTSNKLRKMGHDVLTCQENGRAEQKISDEEVLADATSLRRAVLTQNRGHFMRLHRRNPKHNGIVSCTFNSDFDELAQCVHKKLIAQSKLAGELVRVYRPDRPTWRTV